MESASLFDANMELWKKGPWSRIVILNEGLVIRELPMILVSNCGCSPLPGF